MTDRIKVVKELIANLEALAIEQSKPLNRNDTHIIQSLYNIHHYLQSNVDYDASGEIEMIRFEIEGCSDEVKTLVSPMLKHHI